MEVNLRGSSQIQGFDPSRSGHVGQVTSPTVQMGGHQVTSVPVQLQPPQVQQHPVNNNALQNVNIRQQQPQLLPLRVTEEFAALVGPEKPNLAKGREIASGADLIQEMGREPKKNRKLFGFIGPRVWPAPGATYRSVVAKLDAYNDALGKTAPRSESERADQTKKLKGQLIELNKAIENRLAKKDEPAMRELQGQIAREYRALERLEKAGQLPDSPALKTFNDVVNLMAKGVPVSAASDLDVYDDRNLDNNHPPRPLGSGAMNTVTELRYQNGETMVFKPLTTNMGAPAEQLGIDKFDTRFGNRNVAVSLVDQALGLGLIPKTKFAVHNGEIGIVMEKAGGKAPNDPGTDRLKLDRAMRDKIDKMQQEANPYERDDYMTHLGRVGAEVDKGSGTWVIRPPTAEHMDSTNPEVMRQLSDLEWLDVLTSGGDRHPGNYLIDVAQNGQVTVKGIDNDYAFSGTVTDPKESVTEKMTGLPRLITDTTAQKFKDLKTHFNDEGGLKAQLQPLLSQQEMAALESRLDGLLEHIETLENDGLVVQDWSSFSRNGETAHDIMMETPPFKPLTYVANLQFTIERAQDIRNRFG
jgi:hypothetical protein